jgi:hypothetical protein
MAPIFAGEKTGETILHAHGEERESNVADA